VSFRVRRLSLLLFGLGCAGCAGGDNLAPQLDPIPNQVAAVGVELDIALRAKDPDGDPVSFGYKSDIGKLGTRASITGGAGGTALFKYVPIGSDVGVHEFRFSASDGKDATIRIVQIEVKSSAGGAGTPVFVKPLGNGTTLDLTASTCVDLPLEIADADSTQVTLGQEAPIIEGAEIQQDQPMSGTWHWCPTSEQMGQGELFSLVLSADDGDNPKVTKDYLVVLQKGNKPNCPGAAPTVEHQPADQSTTLDLAIVATVSDDKGLKYPPLLYYSESDPGPSPNLGQMTQITMQLAGGDMQNGQWQGEIPNPTAELGQGASAELHYVVVASDNDDETGDCDHSTRAPSTGSYAMNVTNSGQAGGLAACASCSADVQCGGTDDYCIYVGSKKACGQFCVDDYDCPTTHYCSTSEVLSVGGKTGYQCIPSSGTCGGSSGTCQDDQYEENDVLSDVKQKPGMSPGSYQLKSCPGAVFDDEDWYPIDLAGDANVTASLQGGSASNLDLMLTDSTGKVVASSAGPDSYESLSKCLTAGRYYFHIWAWSQAENSYTLDWSKSSGCSAQCVDDSNEDDDNISQARSASLPFSSSGQQICSGDEDWYEVQMFSSETLYSTLKFTQDTSSQDLDLYLYDSTGKQLTACSESDPLSCDYNNGASGDSNEKLTWPISTSGYYYVVVHGWKGAANQYDICISYSSTGCP
jgi:Bacterial pre-peptidase C-terminal domain